MTGLLRRLQVAASQEVRGCEWVRPSRDVLCARNDDRCVLLDLRAEQYIGLDAVGSRIWSAIEQGEDNAALLAELAQEYDAPLDVLERDTQQFVRELYQRGLVVPA